MTDGREEYLEKLLDVIQSIASGNYLSRIEEKSDDEILNVIGLGINMLGEEIYRSFQNQKTIEEDLIQKNRILISTQEEVRSMNEELQASNEELISMNNEIIESQNELSVLNDNLDQKVIERTKEIEKLLDQKDAFINQLGHDLKTPLGPIISLMPIIQNKTNDPKLSEMIDVVLKSTERLKILINKLLKLAALNAPSTTLDFEPTDIVSEIRSILQLHQTTIDEKEIHVENNINGELVCDLDRVYFNELIENLLSNAIKYSASENKKIVLSNMYDNEHITLSISDNGIGLTENQIQKIFDEFYKADESRHELSSHGLGLNISKKIVEKHHGKIWAESPGIGQGATFFVTLPWKQNSYVYAQF